MNKAKLIEKYQGIFDNLVNMPHSPNNEVLKSRYAEVLTDLQSLPDAPEWIPIKEGDELPNIEAYITFQRNDGIRFTEIVSNAYDADLRSLTLGFTIIAYMPITIPEPYAG